MCSCESSAQKAGRVERGALPRCPHLGARSSREPAVADVLDV